MKHAQISQIQGNTPATLTIQAINITLPGSTTGTGSQSQGGELISQTELGTGASTVNISDVKVYASDDKTVLADSAKPGTQNGITFTAGTGSNGAPAGAYKVAGLVAGQIFDWTTSSPHDQALISNVSGKFDIGAFQIIQNQPIDAQHLPFAVQATDGDGDYQQASFNINIAAHTA